MVHSIRHSPVRQLRIPALDGLRGYAVLLVLISHVTMNSFPGYVGVDIFFVLSGFLITNLLRLEHVEYGTVKYGEFLKRRFFRLYPSLILAAILGAICMTLLGGLTGQFAADAAVSLLYLEPWAIAFFSWDGGLFRHTWSLGIEEFFYLVWPVIFIITLRFREKIAIWLSVAGTILLVVPVIFSGTHQESNAVFDYVLRIGGIVLGCFISFLPSESFKKFSQLFFIFGVLGIIASASMTSPGAGSLTAALSTCLLIQTLRIGSSWASSLFFENSIIKWFGKISYELYLVHYILIVAVIWGLAGLNYSNSEIRNVLPAVGVVTILVAFLTHIAQSKIRSLAVFR